MYLDLPLFFSHTLTKEKLKSSQLQPKAKLSFSPQRERNTASEKAPKRMCMTTEMN